MSFASDVNPRVHAWAAIFLYRIDLALTGEPDLEFLKRRYGKLALNFSWWINQKDRYEWQRESFWTQIGRMWHVWVE